MKLLTNCEKCSRFSFSIKRLYLNYNGLDVVLPKSLCRSCAKQAIKILQGARTLTKKERVEFIKKQTISL